MLLNIHSTKSIYRMHLHPLVPELQAALQRSIPCSTAPLPPDSEPLQHVFTDTSFITRPAQAGEALIPVCPAESRQTGLLSQRSLRLQEKKPTLQTANMQPSFNTF